MRGLRKDGETPEGRLGGWSVGGTINPPGDLFPDPKGMTSIDLQCQLDRPQVFTVEFRVGPTNATSSGGLTLNTPVAVIEWSTNGDTVRRKVSVVNGTSISGPAEFVKVKMFDESEDAAAHHYVAVVTVTPGTRGGDVPPTLQNQPLQSFGAGSGTLGSGVIFPIPEDVGAVMFRVLVWNETGPLTMGDVIVRQETQAGATIDAVMNPSEEGWIPIAPGAVQVEVGTFNGSETGEAFIIFAIDG